MKCTKTRFLEDVKEHSFTILKDDGLYRHLRFQKKDSCFHYFDLITWPNHLCITGDMQTFVFSRIEDMFNFFRSKDNKLKINEGYWAEKLLAVNRQGYEEYSEEEFNKNIKECFENWEFKDKKQKKIVWEEIKENILSDAEFETVAYRLAEDFKSSFGHEFTDFWEYDSKEYNYQYVWCLYAIVWGISKYDKILNSRIAKEKK